jgi:HD domain
MRLRNLTGPASAPARAAFTVASEYHSPSLLNHSVRSHLWAAAIGISSGIEFDDELLYVSAMLHDLGLVEAFDNHALPFEEASGHVARVFGAGAGWPRDRCARAAEVIVAHMRGSVDPAADPEGFLLERATALDISGRHLDLVPPALRSEVLREWPRLSLAAEFDACFAGQAARKPESAAGLAVRSGISRRLAGNPLEQE